MDRDPVPSSTAPRATNREYDGELALISQRPYGVLDDEVVRQLDRKARGEEAQLNVATYAVRRLGIAELAGFDGRGGPTDAPHGLDGES